MKNAKVGWRVKFDGESVSGLFTGTVSRRYDRGRGSCEVKRDQGHRSVSDFFFTEEERLLRLPKFKIDDVVVAKIGDTKVRGRIRYVYNPDSDGTIQNYNIHLDSGRIDQIEEDLLEAYVTSATTTTTIDTATQTATATVVEAPVVIASGNPAPTSNQDGFLRECARALSKVARIKKSITTDDVWAALGSKASGDPRALGAVMLEAAKQGRIKATARYKATTRKEAHRRPLRVWKSLIFGLAQ